jgi:hypothetical protein
MSFKVPNQYRVRLGRLASSEMDGNNGVFFIESPDRRETSKLKVIASDWLGWEHVSVSLPLRCPTWAEMCFIKGMFWDDEDCVMQLHQPKSDLVNNHKYCLHLWRPVHAVIPIPMIKMVGNKEMGLLV